jgi:hypothetical protein
VLLVVKTEHRDALETSLDFATLAELSRRAKRPRRRVSAETAALVCLAASRAPRRRNPRLNPWPRTLDWALAGELRRPTSSAATVGRRPAACSHPASLDSDPTRRIESRHHLNLQAIAAIRSRSNGSGLSQLESASQTPAGPGSFAENPPSFLIFADIPFHLRRFPTI